MEPVNIWGTKKFSKFQTKNSLFFDILSWRLRQRPQVWHFFFLLTTLLLLTCFRLYCQCLLNFCNTALQPTQRSFKRRSLWTLLQRLQAASRCWIHFSQVFFSFSWAAAQISGTLHFFFNTAPPSGGAWPSVICSFFDWLDAAGAKLVSLHQLRTESGQEDQRRPPLRIPFENGPRFTAFSWKLNQHVCGFLHIVLPCLASESLQWRQEQQQPSRVFPVSGYSQIHHVLKEWSHGPRTTTLLWEWLLI